MAARATHTLRPPPNACARLRAILSNSPTGRHFMQARIFASSQINTGLPDNVGGEREVVIRELVVVEGPVDLASENKRLREKVESLETRLKEHQKLHQDFKELVEKKDKQIEELAASNEALMKENKKLKKKIGKLEKAIEKLETANGKLAADIKDLKTANGKQETTINNHETTISKLEADLAELMSEKQQRDADLQVRDLVAAIVEAKRRSPGQAGLSNSQILVQAQFQNTALIFADPNEPKDPSFVGDLQWALAALDDTGSKAHPWTVSKKVRFPLKVTEMEARQAIESSVLDTDDKAAALRFVTVLASLNGFAPAPAPAATS